MTDPRVERVDYAMLELRATGATYEEIGEAQVPAITRQRVWQRLLQAKRRHSWPLRSFDPAAVRSFLGSRLDGGPKTE